MTDHRPDDGDAPDWFVEALAQPGESRWVEVDGARIHYLSWGPLDARPLVLVHGGAAHARWWSPLAPLLARDHRVAAIDLSGHGDSDWRGQYGLATWVDEVMTVAEAVGGVGRPLVVGHSMGGIVTLAVAAEHGARLDGVVALDAPVRRPDPETEEALRPKGGMFREPKRYPDLDTAVGHFHLVPPQPTRNPWIVDFVARTSLAERDGAWQWKFDPRVFTFRVGPNRMSDVVSKLAAVACRLAVVSAEHSAVLDEDSIAYVREVVVDAPAASAGVPFVEVPAAHHHLMFDEPLATVTALRAIFAAWAPVGAPAADVRLAAD